MSNAGRLRRAAEEKLAEVQKGAAWPRLVQSYGLPEEA